MTGDNIRVNKEEAAQEIERAAQFMQACAAKLPA